MFSRKTAAGWVLMSWIPFLCVSSEKCPAFCICDNIKHSAACVKRNLTEIPVTIPQVTQKLDIKGNNIKVIPNGAFLQIPYLTYLNIQNCNVESIEEGAFRGLGRLSYLNLGLNKITIIHQESFDGLSSLKQLILDKNSIEEIKPGAFSQLGFLNFLNLGENFLVYLPDMVFQGLQQIKWIRLSNNMLNIIADGAFATITSLQRLSLNNNELQYLPTEALSKLVNVIKLEMGNNPMTYIGEEAVNMPSLKILLMDNMALQDVSHKAFEKTPKLTVLDLKNNQLRVLQPLDGVDQLKVFNLTGNPIICNCYMRPFKEWMDKARINVDLICAGPSTYRGEKLEAIRPINLKCESYPEEEHLPVLPVTQKPKKEGATPCPENCDCSSDLQHSTCENKGLHKIPKGFPPDTRLLDMRYNEFYTVPRNAFSDMKNVISLHLQNCKIDDLQPGAFLGMKKLVYLYLSDNLISTLNPAAFEGVPQLTYLYLEHNRFTSIPKGAFKLLPNLLSLHLQYNSISYVTGENLAGAEKLRWFYLSGNNINYIGSDAFNFAEELEKLHLDDNQISEVPIHALKKMPILEELKLSKNPIKQIGNFAFLPLADSLKNIYLDNMGLEKIASGAFAGLGEGLRELYLDGNKLENLPSLDNFTSIDVVTLNNNPFKCDCQLLHLRKWLDKMNLKITATCGQPASLKGRNVQKVSFEKCPGESSGKLKTTPRAKVKEQIFKKEKAVKAHPTQKRKIKKHITKMGKHLSQRIMQRNTKSDY